MNKYGFLLAYKDEIWRGSVHAETEKEAKVKILNEEWDEIYDKSKMVGSCLNKQVVTWVIAFGKRGTK